MDNDLQARETIEVALKMSRQLVADLEALSQSDKPLRAIGRIKLAKLLEYTGGEIEALTETFEWSARSALKDED